MALQIGSYFGGSLCVLDLNSDNNTDFLVVGAPLYYNHHPQLEGRVYIYKLTQKVNTHRHTRVSNCVLLKQYNSMRPQHILHVGLSTYQILKFI